LSCARQFNWPDAVSLHCPAGSVYTPSPTRDRQNQKMEITRPKARRHSGILRNFPSKTPVILHFPLKTTEHRGRGSCSVATPTGSSVNFSPNPLISRISRQNFNRIWNLRTPRADPNRWADAGSQAVEITDSTHLPDQKTPISASRNSGLLWRLWDFYAAGNPDL
jgi:hypothetical protein